MLDSLISIVALYMFILLGFSAKKLFKEKVSADPLVILSMYFLQPILIFWGITQKQLYIDALLAPTIFISVVLVCLTLTYLLFHKEKDQRDRTINIVTSLNTNTGNMGIPLGIALFGTGSIIYTTMINLFNSIFNYTFVSYFYSRGKFSVKESILNTLKLPLLWSMFIGVCFNLLHIPLHSQILSTLEIGGHAAICVQLLIFGISLAGIHIGNVGVKPISISLLQKFLLMPSIGIIILSFIDIPFTLKSIIMLTLATPLAVNNINMSHLFNCKPRTVTTLVFFSSFVAIVYIPLLMYLLHFIF